MVLRTIRAPCLAVAVALALGGCTLFQIQDSYGNRYGGWYEHGDQYRYQMTLCERQIATSSVPATQRPASMRACMWRHGVPKGNTTPAAET